MPKEAPQTESLYPTTKPIPDFGGAKDPSTARLVHQQNEESIRDRFEKQQMNPASADLGQEAVRHTAHAAARKAAKATQKPRPLSQRKLMHVDVTRARVEHDPGVYPPRIEPLDDTETREPYQPPKPTEPSVEDAYRAVEPFSDTIELPRSMQE